MIYRTTTYYKIRHLKKKIKSIQGSQGAGKNIAIAQILLEDCAIDKDITTVMTDTYDNLKDGAIADFKMLYEGMNLNWDNDYNKTDKELRHAGGLIQFRYISDNKKSAGKSKRRNKLYINEANKIGWEIASTYIGRTHGDVYLDYNADCEFWAHTEVPKIQDQDGESLSERIIVTYLDNEMLPQGEIDYILSRKDNLEWFRVYGLGETGSYSDRKVYTYKECEVPETAIQINSGMDFGSSPAPTTLVNLYIEGPNLYLDQIFALNNLLPKKITGAEQPSIVDHMDSIQYPKGQLIIADSAGRISILDLVKHKYNVIAIRKYTGGQKDGIGIVRSYNLFITKRSTLLKKEADGWFWKVDRNGKIIPEPDGHEPDCLVAVRYAMMYNRTK